MQALRPEPLLYFPASHFAQSALPEVAYVPGVHATHAVPIPEWKPAPHVLHPPEPGEFWTEPAGHWVQALLPLPAA